jgi:hypothetical protein
MPPIRTGPVSDRPGAEPAESGAGSRPANVGVPGGRRPRSRAKRALLTAVTFVPCVLLTLAIRDLMLSWTDSEVVSYLVSVVIPAALTAWLAPKVSYRRRDAAWSLLGIGFYFVALFIWRATLLPHRDWDPRPDEQDAAHWVTDLEYGALWGEPGHPTAGAGRPADLGAAAGHDVDDAVW